MWVTLPFDNPENFTLKKKTNLNLKSLTSKKILHFL